MKGKCLVIGLDGATFRIADPLIREGKMPVLASVMRNGIRGELLSGLPPATFPTWTTFMTGVNPGRHGIFDFTGRVERKYAVTFLNSTFIRCPTLWRILSDRGRKVIVLGVPVTFPPEKVNGILIAGFDSPVTTRIDGRFVYPRGLYREILKRFGPYPVADIQELNIGSGWHEKARGKLIETIERKRDIALHMMKSYEWDFFMQMFGESDTSAHHFWMFHDGSSPRRGKGMVQGMENVLEEVYVTLDEAVGALIEEAGKDCPVIILSDHGFGGSGTAVFYLNRWLDSSGFLSFKSHGGSVQDAAARTVKKMALRWMPVRMQEFMFRAGGGILAHGVESAARFGGIDWGDTKAYSEELNYAPSVWINLRGREPEGIVNPGKEYEELRDNIVKSLEEALCPFNGERPVGKVFRREEIYTGPEVGSAPDLLIEMGYEHMGGNEYSFNYLSSESMPGDPFRKLAEDELTGSKGHGMNGSHRPEGIFLMRGAGLKESFALDTVRMEDAAPTILYFMGEEIPAHLEGSIPEAAFEGRVTPKRSDPEMPVIRKKSRSASKEDQDSLRKKLTGLGYIDGGD